MNEDVKFLPGAKKLKERKVAKKRARNVDNRLESGHPLKAYCK